MYSIPLPFSDTAIAWRTAARALLAARVLPESVTWSPDMTAPLPALPKARYRVRVPERFLAMAGIVVWHSDPDRFARLYAMAFRLLAHPELLNDSACTEMADLFAMEQQVLRAHRMLKSRLYLHDLHRPVARRAFAGWVDTPHDPLELTRQEFTRRFSDIDVSIYTPNRAAHWISGRLVFQPAPPRPALPKKTSDPFWAAWLRDHVPDVPFAPMRLALPAPSMISDQVLNKKCMTSPSLTI